MVRCDDDYNNNKPFKNITREDIPTFLNSFVNQKEASDPLYKWIGTLDNGRI